MRLPLAALAALAALAFADVALPSAPITFVGEWPCACERAQATRCLAAKGRTEGVVTDLNFRRCPVRPSAGVLGVQG